MKKLINLMVKSDDMKLVAFVLLYLFLITLPEAGAQCLSPVNFQTVGVLPANPFPNIHHNLTAKRDSSASKPYLYVAGMEQGLVIYNIASTTSPTMVVTIPPSALSNLYVMNITQAGNYLYLALGDHFNATAQKSGMGIIDISNPALPAIKSVYSFTANSGCGHIAVDGNYAFMSAMQNGILIMDVTSATSPSLVSQFFPDINFPKNNPTTSEKQKINVRSMVIKNNIAYVCYDAGGMRTVNTSNKSALIEIGKYSNPALLNYARAYNNLILNDTLVYVATDYAGMEILNVKNTASVTTVSWWNPWAAGTAANNWFNSPGHTNEIEFDADCKLVFMSAGRSDVMAVSVANPLLPDSCSQFGTKADSNGTWGIGRYGNQLYLGYIVTPLPFYSNWSGVKIVNYNGCNLGLGSNSRLSNAIRIYPNPSIEMVNIELEKNIVGKIYLFNSTGKLLQELVLNNTASIQISTRDYANGIYFLKIKTNKEETNKKIVIAR